MTTGTLYTISAPSGAGKTSLVKSLLDKMGNVGASISHTTRDKRPGEIEGQDYHFVSTTTFLEMIADKQFLEHAKVFRNYYGTSKIAVETMLNKGQDVILEIDWQGMQQVKELCPNCVSISILPPSLDDLSARLSGRQTDSEEEIEHRMSQAKEEMSHAHECDYIVINDSFDVALADLSAIIISRRLRGERQTVYYSQLLAELTS